MKCPKCGGGLERLRTSSEPEEIRRDARCIDCGRTFMVTKAGLAEIEL